MEFRHIIKQLREEANVSQRQLADAVGVSNSTIAMYENGQRTPSALVYEALADYFNVDLDYLYLKSPVRSKIRFTNAGNPYDIRSIDAGQFLVDRFGADVRDLVNNYLRLNSAGRDKLSADLEDMLQLDKYTKKYVADAAI